MSNVTLDDRGNALENEYFYRQEQELIAKMKAKLSEESTKSTDVKCPKCDGILHETDYETIKIDVCDKCHGVWFDSGELAQVTNKDKGGWFSKIFG
jgi:ribosomal protein L31